ncbi:MAG: uracil-DNA glycosylase [Betaproteobacteria bacterium]|nr:uracil-DNA glycosylase [Betaproteobacteria bacterium]NBX91025.1 uracil-DNA glycosylase [Betaproteobacteria bacterium]
MTDKPPNTALSCWKCKHFATSWVPAMPYSCKLFGFKSQVLPCIQVLKSDGKACLGFESKTKPP